MRKTTDKMTCRLYGADKPKVYRIIDAIEKLDKLIWKMANAFHSKIPHIDIEDLYQQGCLGVICAWQKFDPEKGTAFITYANWWILKNIQTFCSQNEYAICLNTQNQKLYKEYCMMSGDALAELPTEGKNGALARLAKSNNGLTKKLDKDEFSEEDASLQDMESEHMAAPILEKILSELKANLPPLPYYVVVSTRGLSGEAPVPVKDVCLRLGVTKDFVAKILEQHQEFVEKTLASVSDLLYS